MIRVTKARKVTRALNPVLWQHNITLNTKMRMYDAILKSILTFGSEAWQMTKKSENKLLTTEMDLFRRAARISKCDHGRNEKNHRKSR